MSFHLNWSAKYLFVPVAYLFLVKNLNKYYLNNELRFLYKQDILVPWIKRVDDSQCVDRRDLRHELAISAKVDEEKSLVHKLEQLVDHKGYDPTPQQQTPLGPGRDDAGLSPKTATQQEQDPSEGHLERSSNMNLIERSKGR